MRNKLTIEALSHGAQSHGSISCHVVPNILLGTPISYHTQPLYVVCFFHWTINPAFVYTCKEASFFFCFSGPVSVDSLNSYQIRASKPAKFYIRASSIFGYLINMSTQFTLESSTLERVGSFFLYKKQGNFLL